MTTQNNPADSHAPQAIPAETLHEIERLERRVEDARQKGEPAVLIDALLALGCAYFDTGNTPKGLTQIEEGLALAESSGNQEAEARLWATRGWR